MLPPPHAWSSRYDGSYLEKNVWTNIKEVRLPGIVRINMETATSIKAVPDMTLRQVYRSTIQTAIDIIQDISNIVSDKPYLSDTTFRRKLVETFTLPSRRLYVGIWLIVIAFIFYFIDSTA